MLYWNKKDRWTANDDQIDLPLVVETRMPYIRGEEYTEKMLEDIGCFNGNGKVNVTGWLENKKEVYTNFSVYWLSE